MEKVLLFVIGATALSAVSSSKYQYHFVYEKKTWSEAQMYCREKHTDLATVENSDVMATLNDMVDLMQLGNVPNAWVGLYDDVNEWRWSYSDEAYYQGYSKDFRVWLSQQPDNAGGVERCLEVLRGGEWNDIPCTQTQESICMTAGKQRTTFTLIRSLMTWADAQSHCRTYYTDLASVRTSTEYQDLLSVKPAEDVWLGLFRDGWKWSNGAQLTYTNWAIGEPNNQQEYCAAADFRNAGRWLDDLCENTKAFICYGPMPRYSKHVMRLKLQGSPMLNLSNAFVLEDLLGKLKQKLVDENEKADIKLSWRHKPGGKIFYNEKEEK